SEHQRMRCPHQDGDFPFPVKYGYALVGVIAEGPADRLGQAVFVLHPHQSRACVPLADLHALPAGLDPRRACLAANMETAVNIGWDAEFAPGQRVLIVGAGVLGLLTAAVAARTPGATVTVTDIDQTRAALAAAMGATFAMPEQAPGEQDIVIHTSATESGLRRALACAAFEGRVVEASWYGDAEVRVPLGGAFHSRRLRLISSQVGAVAPSRRQAVTRAQRLDFALELLREPRFDALIGAEIAFADAALRLPAALNAASGLMTVLRYT
ncbi:MAG: zinc-binding alcohol dehydrogenase, partial [Rhodospirillaceae bacterium]|nr:zinc-binding alcohol dehydrogenase [Rhodospirillaceae bacterium]